MSLVIPSRRELIASAPLLIGAAVMPAFAVPRERGLRFFVIGDWGRAGMNYQRHVARAMGVYADSFAPQFVISTGDNFYQLGVASRDGQQWHQSFEGIYTAPSLRDPPWYAVLGNHDYGNNVYAQLQRNEVGRWRMPRKWYSVHFSESDGARVDFFFIDTVTWKGDETWFWELWGDDVLAGEMDAQKAWLEQSLSDSKAPIKFVVGHFPIYSVGPHGGTKELEDLDRMLCRHGVTAYICGHDHCMYHISRSAGPGSAHHRHYICSGAGSEVLVKYTGGCNVGDVFNRRQRDIGAGRPLWHKFLGHAKAQPASSRREYDIDGAFAAFEVWNAGAELQFIDGRGAIRHRATMAAIPRPDDLDACNEPLWPTPAGAPVKCSRTAQKPLGA